MIPAVVLSYVLTGAVFAYLAVAVPVLAVQRVRRMLRWRHGRYAPPGAR